MMSEEPLYSVLRGSPGHFCAPQHSELHVPVSWGHELCSGVKAFVVMTWHGSAAASLFPRNPTRHRRQGGGGGGAHAPAHLLLLLFLLLLLGFAPTCGGEPLGQLPGPVSEADVQGAVAFLRVQPDVDRVPQHPPHQAEEDDERARVDEEIPVEAALGAEVAEDPDQQHHQAGHVEHHGQEEQGSAGPHAAVGHAGGGERRTWVRAAAAPPWNADCFGSVRIFASHLQTPLPCPPVRRPRPRDDVTESNRRKKGWRRSGRCFYIKDITLDPLVFSRTFCLVEP